MYWPVLFCAHRSAAGQPHARPTAQQRPDGFGRGRGGLSDRRCVFHRAPIPVFAGFGLAKGALLATEAAASIAVYLAKALAFGAVGGLPLPVLCNGLVVGAALSVGTFVGKRFVLGMSEATFRLLIDIMLACAGLVMTGGALFG